MQQVMQLFAYPIMLCCLSSLLYFSSQRLLCTWNLGAALLAAFAGEALPALFLLKRNARPPRPSAPTMANTAGGGAEASAVSP